LKKLDNGIVVSSSSKRINNEGVTHTGNEKELEKMCSNLLELDLARNDLNDLNEVFFRINKKIAFTYFNIFLKKIRLRSFWDQLKDYAF
jgi:hypothetical protein